jgi:hypothetical protein
MVTDGTADSNVREKSADSSDWVGPQLSDV